MHVCMFAVLSVCLSVRLLVDEESTSCMQIGPEIDRQIDS